MSLKRGEVGEESRMAAGGWEGVVDTLLLSSATFITSITWGRHRGLLQMNTAEA